MLKHLLIALVLSLFAVTCPAKKTPKIKVEKTEYDLGTIDRKKVSAVQTFDIVVKNIGKADLVIKEVVTDCESCTKVDVPVKVVKSRKSIKLHVTYNSTKLFGGLYTKYIYIRSNDPTTPEVEVSFKSSLR